MTVTIPASKTAAEWLEMARNCEARSAESFARSDSDGFLSQWAAQKMAQRYRDLAKIAENNGMAEFLMLADLDGNLLDARYVKTRYGWAWAITTDHGTKWFNESNARKGETRRKAHANKGYKLVEVMRECVMFDGGEIKPANGSTPANIREADYPNW